MTRAKKKHDSQKQIILLLLHLFEGDDAVLGNVGRVADALEQMSNNLDAAEGAKIISSVITYRMRARLT